MIIQFKMVQVAEVHTRCWGCDSPIVIDIPEQSHPDGVARFVSDHICLCEQCDSLWSIVITPRDWLIGMVDNATH